MQAEQETQTGAQAGAELTGRAAVRFYLLAPLAGLPRKRGMAADLHKKLVDGLVTKLAYMTPRNLRGLAELVLRQGADPKRPHWPETAIVLSWAYGLQQPPPRQSDYAQSLIRSAMGRQARDQGWVVELFQVAKRLGPPPGKYITTKLREEAADNLRRRDRIRERAAVGCASPDELRWLDRWWADQAECEALLGMDQAGEVAA